MEQNLYSPLLEGVIILPPQTVKTDDYAERQRTKTNRKPKGFISTILLIIRLFIVVCALELYTVTEKRS
jgi:hypothetical protein